ncbi:MAG: cytochrome c oxidase assembly protein [Deltaproteobacteria bacterium]|nr:cytochrome c oxidase assembly protein [Deltaproteobacteria bacterium]
MDSRQRITITLSLVALTVLFLLPTLYLSLAGPRSSNEEPVQVLQQYLRAIYARDYRRAYGLISSVDQHLKNEQSYVRERGGFSGFTLELSKRIASFIEAKPLSKQITADHARIRLKFYLPDANSLSSSLLDWDEDRLNTLSPQMQAEMMALVEKLRRERRIPVIEGEDDYELVKEKKGWRVYLNWAAGIKLVFLASVPPELPIEAAAAEKEVLIHPGELFRVVYRVKNRSENAIFARIAHRVEPKDVAPYLDLVECGLLFPVKLAPGQENEYSTTYFIRGDLPEKVRRLDITYEFKVPES